ncbi:hypothetical protein BGZ47_002523 [Haplosporangium gracile]|nr:hypothetical protein BGZ47_002523 [Haplosporangium gracile]
MVWKEDDDNEPFTSNAAPPSAPTAVSSAATRKRSRRVSISSQAVTESDFQIDSSTFEKELYWIGPVNVGQIFHDFQHTSANLVNQLSIRISMKNIHYFLAINYIFDLTSQTPQGMSKDIFETIKNRCAVEPMELPDDQATLCVVLGREMSRTGRVIPRLLDDPNKMDILFLFQTLDSDYSFGWANEVDEGSRARRGDGYKPDGYLRKMDVCICVVEIKSPRQAHSDKAFIEDYWKLANFCKDGIDDHLENGRGVDKMTAVQVFGHQLSVYTMEFKSGIYHWSQLGACYLPVDRTDGSRILPCMELLRTLERYLSHINVNCVPTPPSNDDRDKVGKPSALSPKH